MSRLELAIRNVLATPAPLPPEHGNRAIYDALLLLEARGFVEFNIHRCLWRLTDVGRPHVSKAGA